MMGDNDDRDDDDGAMMMCRVRMTGWWRTM